jgi:exodeoxyribonuclease-3
MSAYVPNGGEVGSDKWDFKLRWLDRLRRYLDRRHAPGDSLILCGDFNVAPEAIDAKNPADWEGTVLFHPDARAALAHVTAFGLRDLFRQHRPEPGLYSWWDYRQLGFPKNNGLRIDHVFGTAPVAERCRAASIDREERKGTGASDHAPVFVEIA